MTGGVEDIGTSAKVRNLLRFFRPVWLGQALLVGAFGVLPPQLVSGPLVVGQEWLLFLLEHPMLRGRWRFVGAKCW